MSEKCWLPGLELYEDYNDWSAYEETLYRIFKADFLDSHPLFHDVRVAVRHYPKDYGKEEAFFHTTCKDYKGDGTRDPDFRRCERIRWIRAFIENYDCDATKCDTCEGVKVWKEPYNKGRVRVHLLLEEEKYMVVLEKRDTYYLLITSFYFDYEHSLEKQLKHYEKYKEK
ncbi:MAG: hypothetical protein IK055_10510 [Lachnospiraceae bacterium]|nr:hypothetical protein [Lachnospiraceae bacterium]